MAKVARTSNQNARLYVQAREAFKGSNTYGVWHSNPDIYVVYSYGDHWPLFIYQDGHWFENCDKYSVSTSKHRTQLHPHTDTTLMDSGSMICIAMSGMEGLAALGPKPPRRRSDEL